jgi:hypothetical protein
MTPAPKRKQKGGWPKLPYKTKQLTGLVPEDDVKALVDLGKRLGVRRSDMLRLAVRMFLEAVSTVDTNKEDTPDA